MVKCQKCFHWVWLGLLMPNTTLLFIQDINTDHTTAYSVAVIMSMINLTYCCDDAGASFTTVFVHSMLS